MSISKALVYLIMALAFMFSSSSAGKAMIELREEDEDWRYAWIIAAPALVLSIIQFVLLLRELLS